MKKTLNLVYIALAAVLITLCSWIQIPTVVPFTMQTFAIFCVLSLLGGKRGTAAILLYLILGTAGLPVFAQFTSGPGILLGTTGGYLTGFLFLGLFYWVLTALFGKKLWAEILAMTVGLAILYAFGTAWFLLVYGRTTGSIGIGTALSWCVFPFILPDLAKMALALLAARRIAASHVLDGALQKSAAGLSRH